MAEVLVLCIKQGKVGVARLRFAPIAPAATAEGATLKIVAYSAVALLANLVPVVGGLAALVWTVYLVAVGLAVVHRTTQSKALAATLIPVSICCGALIASVVLIGTGVLTLLGGLPLFD